MAQIVNSEVLVNFVGNVPPEDILGKYEKEQN
jgi:hypothetical protein